MSQLSHGFQRLIKHIPKTKVEWTWGDVGVKRNTKVLDVGGGGLDGANTTNFLRARFKDITLIEIAKGRIERYVEKFGIKGVKTIDSDFYKYKFKEKFDLIVLDLNIDNNIKMDWTPWGLKKIHKLLNPEGIVIIYVMTTYEYGDGYTYIMIKNHMRGFWGNIPPTRSIIRKKLKQDYADLYDVFSIVQEGIRDTIIWVALKKNG